jgi:hypothetical protein
MKENMKKIPSLFISCDSEKEVISIMEENSFDLDICKFGISLLENEKNVLFIMKKSGYDPGICGSGMSLIEKPENVMLIMQKTKYKYPLCYLANIRLAVIESKKNKK